MLRKLIAAKNMLLDGGPAAVLGEVRKRAARALRGYEIGHQFLPFAVYQHADGQRIPLYTGYRDYLKPLHVLAHATPTGQARYERDNQRSHIEATGVGGAISFLTMLRELGVDPAGKHVLDVGCGDGALAFLLASHGATVQGIELEERPQSWEPAYLDRVVSAVSQSRAAGTQGTPDLKARVALFAMDIQRPTIDTRFDLIVSNSVLEHITDLRTGLTKMRQLLKPEG